MRGDFDEDEFDDDGDYGFLNDDSEEDWPFDCSMDRNGMCGKAGSEECDFECPVMAAEIRANARKELVKKARKK